MTGRHFLVIGGTRGIGRALVTHLVGAGEYCVSVLGRSVGEDIQSSSLSHYAVDVSNREALLSSLDQAVMRYGKLTCVAFLQRHRAREANFDAELTVALCATRNAIDHLIEMRGFSDERDSNSIVIVSSTADRFVTPGQSLGYHLGKAGMSHLARYYALSLAPMGIRVNSVSPCVVAKEEAMDYYDKNKWLVDRFRRNIPLGRMGKPQDIVNAIMFLSSHQAAYITGQNLVVDGGLTLLSHDSLIRDFKIEE